MSHSTPECDNCRDNLVINTIGADELPPLEPTNGVEDVTVVVYIFPSFLAWSGEAGLIGYGVQVPG